MNRLSEVASDTPLVFIDTETTALHPDRRVWEVAVIRRDETGTSWRTWQVSDVDLSNADPASLKIGRFYERHHIYRDEGPVEHEIYDLEDEAYVANRVEAWTRGAHLVGLVPWFDADCLDKMLRRHLLVPAWHYHLIDVEAVAVGWLQGKVGQTLTAPPWESEQLSRACDVPPPTDYERHTALGDAIWAMRWYDAITGART